MFEVNSVKPIGAKDKRLRLQKVMNAELNPLHVALTHWMLVYLTEHIEFIQLAVCVECGRIFERERRDNVYCSKTCQNRVAYKRKKIFEAGVLRELAIPPDAATSLRAGLCLYHPRLG